MIPCPFGYKGDYTPVQTGCKELFANVYAGWLPTEKEPEFRLRFIISALRAVFDRRAVGNDLCCALHDRGRGIANIDHSVRAQTFGVIHHALDGDLPRFVEHLRVAGDLSAHQRLDPRHEILAKVLGLHHVALCNPQYVEFLSRNIVNIDQQHLLPLPVFPSSFV